MKDGRKVIYICLVLCAVYLAGLFVSSSFFVKEDGVRIVAEKYVSPSKMLEGNDDPDRPYYELLPGQIVDINSATEQQLSLLPGIGEKLAAEIVAYRQQQGAFSSKEALMNVEGIGKARFAAIQDIISIGEMNEDSGS